MIYTTYRDAIEANIGKVVTINTCSGDTHYGNIIQYDSGMFTMTTHSNDTLVLLHIGAIESIEYSDSMETILDNITLNKSIQGCHKYLVENLERQITSLDGHNNEKDKQSYLKVLLTKIKQAKEMLTFL